MKLGKTEITWRIWLQLLFVGLVTCVATPLAGLGVALWFMYIDNKAKKQKQEQEKLEKARQKRSSLDSHHSESTPSLTEPLESVPGPATNIVETHTQPSFQSDSVVFGSNDVTNCGLPDEERDKEGALRDQRWKEHDCSWKRPPNVGEVQPEAVQVETVENQATEEKLTLGQRLYLYTGYFMATFVCLCVGFLVVGNLPCPWIHLTGDESLADVYTACWKLLLSLAFVGAWFLWCQSLKHNALKKTGEYQRMRKSLGYENSEK